MDHEEPAMEPTPEELAARKIDVFEKSYSNYDVSIETNTETDSAGEPVQIKKIVLTSPPVVITENDTQKESQVFPAGWRRIAHEMDGLMFGDIPFIGRDSKAALQRKENAIQVIKAFCAIEFFLDWEYFSVDGPNRYSMYKID